MISLNLKLFNNYSDYDIKKDKLNDFITASMLTQPIQKIKLESILESYDEMPPPPSIKGKIGTAIHNQIERLWENTKEVDKLLGENTYIINNTLGNSVDPIHEIHTEVRKSINLVSRSGSSWTISGKFDTVINGSVYDIKSTSPRNFTDTVSLNLYKIQLSIYKYLNPEIITKSDGYIDFIFADWKQPKELSDPQYPLISKKISLMSHNETEEYILDFIEKLEQTESPKCTDDERWVRTYNSFKVFFTGYVPGKRASKATNDLGAPLTEQEAFDIVKNHKNPKCEYREIIIKTPPIRCNYCKVRGICPQYKEENGN